LQPDAEHYHLTANIRLVASYQKNALPAVARQAAPATPPALPLPSGSPNIFAGARRVTNSTSLKQ